jgi:predicted unusual protein kinase regulating ubiquinone biosynthesis (AarF/ABC1/UbiB family)
MRALSQPPRRPSVAERRTNGLTVAATMTATMHLAPRRPPSLVLLQRTRSLPPMLPPRRGRRSRPLAAEAATTTSSSSSSSPYPQAPIDPDLAAEYWSRRPVAVAARAAEVAWAFLLWMAGCARRRAAAALFFGQAAGDEGAAPPPQSQPRRPRPRELARRIERADARALRETIARLSPAYIKIAQALAARPDLLPPSYVRELETLQDRLPPFSSDEALALLEQELAPAAARLGGGGGGMGGRGTSASLLPAVFGAISAEPVAAASLGQVYRASLRRDVAARAGFVRWEEGGRGGGGGGSNTNAPSADAMYASEPLGLEEEQEETTSPSPSSPPPPLYVPVAVKVQRPDVAERVSLDCLLLRKAAAVARRLGRLNTDLPSLVDEWSRSLAKELDYEQEGRNAWRLGKGLAVAMGGGGRGGGGGAAGGAVVSSGRAVVRVPRAFGGGLTTRRVLTMEWLEGRRLRSAGGARGKKSGEDEDEDEEEREEQQQKQGRALRAPPSPPSSSSSSSSSAASSSSSLSASERRRDLQLVEIGVRCFLEQILGGEVGFFNADPHAGNLLVLESPSSSSSGGRPGAGGLGERRDGGGGGERGATPSSSWPPPQPPPPVLGILDAGMCAEVSEAQRVALLRAALHLAAGEYAMLAEDLVALDMLPGAAAAPALEEGGGGPFPSSPAAASNNKQRVVAALEDVFRAQLRQPTPLASSSSSSSPPLLLLQPSSDDEAGGGHGPAAAAAADAAAANHNNEGATFGGLGAKLGRTMYKFRFRLPQTFTLLVRALSVLEGLALSADPDYRVVAAAVPWVARRVLLEQSPELRAALRRLLYVQKRSEAGGAAEMMKRRAGGGAAKEQEGQEEEEEEEVFDFARLEALLRSAARVPGGADPSKGRRRTSGGVAGGGGGGGGAGGEEQEQQESALALLLSPDASYVRGLLEDEVAKGLDAAWRLHADRALAPLLLLPALAPPALAPAASAGGGPRQSHPRRLRLSTPSDEAQLEGLSRLAAAVGALAAAGAEGNAGGGGGGGAGRSEKQQQRQCGQAAGRAQAAAAALAWLAREARSLPAEAREEALVRLPLRVAAKLSSRVAARAIRAALL